MPGARGPSTGVMLAVYPLIPGYSRPKLRMFRSGSGLPGQFGLVECLAMDVFQEVGIDLVGDSGGGIRLGARPNWPGWRRGPGRCAGRRVVPESAVFEDLADEVRLMGLDEGDDLHGPAAFGAEQRIGLVDVPDEGGPTAAVEPGRFGNDRLGRRIAARLSVRTGRAAAFLARRPRALLE